MADDLRGAGFEPLAIDLPGHGGRGPAPDGRYDAEAFAADAIAAVDERGIERAHVVGHSMGGQIAWHVAARYPQRVASLVIEDQHPDGSPDRGRYWLDWCANWPWRFATRDEGLHYLRANGRNLAWWEPSLVSQPDGSWGWAFDREAVEGTARQLFAGPDWAALREIRCPTLLIRGASSEHLSAAVAERMRATLPDCRLVTVEGADHWVHGKQRDQFIALLRDHFER